MRGHVIDYTKESPAPDTTQTNFPTADISRIARRRRAGRCTVCGRSLTNLISVELGIGPICRAAYPGLTTAMTEDEADLFLLRGWQAERDAAKAEREARIAKRKAEDAEQLRQNQIWDDQATAHELRSGRRIRSSSLNTFRPRPQICP
jgi:hypothetical protein